MNRADIEELLMAVKGSTGKTMMQTVDLTLPSDI